MKMSLAVAFAVAATLFAATPDSAEARPDGWRGHGWHGGGGWRGHGWRGGGGWHGHGWRGGWHPRPVVGWGYRPVYPAYNRFYRPYAPVVVAGPAYFGGCRIERRVRYSPRWGGYVARNVRVCY
jgi:hypothetical protein